MAMFPHSILSQFFRDSGMSLVQVGRAMGYDTSYISLVVRGKRTITDGFLWRFQETFTKEDSAFYLEGATSVLRDIEQKSSENA